jgi:GalNAc-alpha-(1->4)-GalNAc-alpha-(1->3)-diNAcBac-PP-undecaprenol alpha-1,4-N-acetyl-D-galactosaminyltransferase
MALDVQAASVSTRKRTRLALVVSSLSSGGSERVMSTMANYWGGKSWEVTLITLDSNRMDFYNVDPRVKRIALDVVIESHNVPMALLNNFRRIRAVRKAIKHLSPDAVISFGDATNVLTLISCIGLNIPRKIVAERTNPTVHRLESVWALLRRITYPLADCVVLQTNSIREWARSFLPEKKIVVIPNPICPSNETSCQGDNGVCAIFSESQTKILIGMGRLTHEKGFDMLIRAFAKAAERNTEWKLVIFGDGTEREALNQLVRDAGIADRVFLPGTTMTPAFFLRRADLFVLPSRYEGFPNALLEAMAAGLPVISFDCPSGPAEIIRSGLNGLLVPAEDTEAFASAIIKLIENKAERERLAAKAPEVLERFGLEKIMAKWEALIGNEV